MSLWTWLRGSRSNGYLRAEILCLRALLKDAVEGREAAEEHAKAMASLVRDKQASIDDLKARLAEARKRGCGSPRENHG